MSYSDFVDSIILSRFTPSLEKKEKKEYKGVGGSQAVILYSEFQILLHLLEIPVENFDVAFRMFDLDGNGIVDRKEFDHVISRLLKNLNGFKYDIDEVMLNRIWDFFFGAQKNHKISCEKFKTILEDIRKSILRAEFDLYRIENTNSLSIYHFAITLISSADQDKIIRFLKRIEPLENSTEVVSWEEFYSFHSVINHHLHEMKNALSLNTRDSNSGQITPADFRKAAKVVSGIEIPEKIVKMAFKIFDEDDSGTLDEEEVLKVLELRSSAILRKSVAEQSKVKRIISCILN